MGSDSKVQQKPSNSSVITSSSLQPLSRSLDDNPKKNAENNKIKNLNGENRQRLGKYGHNFANIPVSYSPAPVQAKLTIGQPNDRYEREADSVADRVVQKMNEPPSKSSGAVGQIQRQEMASEQEEEKLAQTKPKITSLQRQETTIAPGQNLLATVLQRQQAIFRSQDNNKLLSPTKNKYEGFADRMTSNIVGKSNKIPAENSSSAGKIQRQEEMPVVENDTTAALESSVEQERGRGESLNDGVRSKFEEGFETDFGDVTVHRDHKSDQLNQAIEARAFTTGEDIFFRHGAYDPESKKGQHLIAHELTHVVQQRGEQKVQKKALRSPQEKESENSTDRSSPQITALQAKLSISQPGDKYEREADRVSADVVERINTPQNSDRPSRSNIVQSKATEKAAPYKLINLLEDNGSALQPKSINTIQLKKAKQSVKSTESAEKSTQEEPGKSAKDGEKAPAPEAQGANKQEQANATDEGGKNTPAKDGEKDPASEAEGANKQEKLSPTGEGGKNTPAKDGEKDPASEAEGANKQEKLSPTGEGENPEAKDGEETQSDLLGNIAENALALGEGQINNDLQSDSATDTAPTSAEEDPGFQEVVAESEQVREQQKEHEPSQTEADAAQDAAEPPSNEVESKAQANQVDEMEGAQTPGFDAAAFKTKLMERIAEMTPKNLEEADNFKDNNQLDEVKGELSGKVDEEKQKSQQDLEEKTNETPDTSGIEGKQVNPLPPQDPGANPENINAKKAAPKSKSQQEVEVPLKNSSEKLDQKLVENNITEEQLAKSNEPQFQQTLDAKKEAQTHATTAPQTYRQSEQSQITQAQAQAETLAQEKVQAMHGERGRILPQVAGNQLTAKGNDEQARSKVAGEINAIYEESKTNVEKILSDLDTQVGSKFDSAAEEGKKLFEDYVGKKMDAYKADRYGGWFGWARWLKDKLFGMPSEVNKFYEEGRKLYLDKMDGAIDKIVDFIGTKLTEAKQEVAKGKQKIQDYVNQLPQDLKSIGTQAAADIQSNFDELEQSIDAKQDELVNTLAQKYQENLDAIDARIEEMKEANKGLVQKAFDFVVGVITTIIKMAALLAKALARAASAIPDILKDPIGFLRNLIEALKQGFLNFMNNIAKHLQTGLLGWLTGTLAEGGIQIPSKLDLSGIFSLVVQLLGMGYEMIRERAVKRLGEERVSKLEQTFEIFKVLATQGVQGLWQFVKDRLGDLKAMVLDPIRDFVIENVIRAGITWILSMLNPASAFVKACQAIYEIVMFFMERAEQIADFINAIIDAVMAIAGGALDQAIKGVENALAKAIPLVISFLARLLGLGNIAGKVQEIIGKLRKPVEGAIDWILDKAVKFAKKTGGKFGGKKDGKFDQKDGKLGKNDDREKKGKEEGKITSADRKKHEKIAAAIQKELTEKPDNSQKSFEDFYKSKTQQAKNLENKYQRQLKKGIKLDIKFKPISQDNKDGDIDVAIKIAPNNLYTTFELETDDDEAKFSKLLYVALKELGEEHHISGHKSEFEKAKDITEAEADFSEQAQTKEKATLDTKKAEKEKEIKEKSKGIHQKILKAQNSYAIACQATIVPNNIFKVGGGEFFVETHDNYYIIPKGEATPKFEYKIPQGQLLKDVLQKEYNDKSKESKIENLEKQKRNKQKLLNNEKLKEKAKAGINKAIEKLDQQLDSVRNQDPTPEQKRLENLASATTQEDKRRQVEFVKEKLNDNDYKHIKNIKQKGGQVKIYLPNDIVKQYDYHSNPIGIQEAKKLYKQFPKTITNSQEHTVFLASLLAEPSRSSVAHITNMLLLNKNSELSKDSEPPKQVNKDEPDQLVTNREKDKLYEHTSMTQPGSDPSGSRTKDYPYDTRLEQGENDKATNINVSNRDLAAIKHNKEVKDKLLKYFKENKGAEDSQLVNYFKKEINKYLKLEKNLDCCNIM